MTAHDIVNTVLCISLFISGCILIGYGEEHGTVFLVIGLVCAGSAGWFIAETIH